MRVKEVTVFGLRTTIVTFVLENALKMDLEMDAELLDKL